MTSKNKIIAAVIAAGVILIVIFFRGFSSVTSDPQRQEPVSQGQAEKISVVGTSPEPLEGATILPTQEVEIFFSEAMVNDPARVTIEPEVKYNAQLSPDHKSIKIQPLEPYKLGQDYTLTFKSGYSSDSGKKLESDKVFHFQTINYNGV